MRIKKDTLLRVRHNRKGVFNAMAKTDFNTKDEWYPLTVAQGKVMGMMDCWFEGETIPCRGDFCRIEIVSEDEI